MNSKSSSEHKFKNLKMRILSALLAAIVFLAIIVHGGVPLVIFTLISLSWAIYEGLNLVFKMPNKKPFLFLLPFYLTLTFFYCVMIRLSYPLPVFLLFLALVWSSDIGAYFAGKFIGGKKMSSVISPNKTWAGFSAALLLPASIFPLWLSMAASFHNLVHYNEITYVLAFLAGMVLGLVGQAGDLVMSYFKRQADVKDSGTLMPGHGGLLDRVDSFLLMGPVFYLFIAYFFYV